MSTHSSIWSATAEMPRRNPLSDDINADVCVIGAGIAGISVAYALAQTGKSVVVLDEGPLAGGDTRMSTAHVVSAPNRRIYELERSIGTPGARLFWQSHAAAIDRIEEIITREKIDCDFARIHGFLFRAPDSAEFILSRELQAAHRIGWSEVELRPTLPLDTVDPGPCLHFPNQAQFHPLKYVDGLLRAIEQRGGRTFADTHVDRIESASPLHVTAGRHTVTAGSVIVATNTPIKGRFGINTQQTPYTTYVVALRVPAGTVPRALYWDTGHPFHYVRLHATGDLEALVVGGEDHETGEEHDPLERYHRLEQWAHERFPMAQKTLARWNGEIMETREGLAYIGRAPLGNDQVYVVTGDAGMGITHATIAGMLLTDLIMNRANPWTELYSLTRPTPEPLPEFAEETSDLAAHNSNK